MFYYLLNNYKKLEGNLQVRYILQAIRLSFAQAEHLKKKVVYLVFILQN